MDLDSAGDSLWVVSWLTHLVYFVQLKPAWLVKVVKNPPLVYKESLGSSMFPTLGFPLTSMTMMSETFILVRNDLTWCNMHNYITERASRLGQTHCHWFCFLSCVASTGVSANSSSEALAPGSSSHWPSVNCQLLVLWALTLNVTVDDCFQSQSFCSPLLAPG